MARDEDKLPQAYPYAWDSSSELSIQQFVTKYKPSMVQDDGTKPWIWAKGPPSPPTEENVEGAVEEANAILTEVTEKVDNIKNDASIPTRSNKKTGAKSKKELREQAQAEATEKLKEISIRHSFVSGKWLIFAPSEKVDMIWSSLATSLAEGPLSSTPAYAAKVATSPKNDTPGYQHVMCLYIPDVYDKDSVTKTMKILLGDHGMNLSGVKSNLYTTIGLDSKHASGIQSTVWKNTALLPDKEIKELKENFFANINTSKSKPPPPVPTDDGDEKQAPAVSKPTKKPVLKKRAAAEDPFASDDDEEDQKSKKQKTGDS